MTIIDFAQAKAERKPHISGDARCLACDHEWEAVAPAGTIWLECPKCTLQRGRYFAHTAPDCMFWLCTGCGSDLFYVTPRGNFCPNCGVWQ